MKTFTIPNILTMARILSVPLFIIFFKEERQLAVIIFLVAIGTDVLDGIIARLRKSRTVLGSILDPLADKILINTAYLLLAGVEIPFWMVVVVISRDIMLVLGWIVTYVITSNIKVEPSIPGKLTNFLQSISVILLLLGFLHINILLYAMIIATAVSMIDYMIKGIKRVGG